MDRFVAEKDPFKTSDENIAFLSGVVNCLRYLGQYNEVGLESTELNDLVFLVMNDMDTFMERSKQT